MMIWKGLGRKGSWLNFKVLSQYLLGGTEKNHEKQDSLCPAEIRTRDVQNTKQSVNH
jgi:hypothetical protein